ncbi:YIP1 family protein [Candidatus Micrarchaeota archaeon]|nr:YIP1 family protein [Candidatus Micrarchaeota archaeon]
MSFGEIFNTVFGWAYGLMPIGKAQVWKGIYATPHETMQKELKNASVMEGIKELVIASIPFTILSMIAGVIMTVLFPSPFFAVSPVNALVNGAINIVLIPIIWTVVLLLFTGVVWILAKIMGGTGTFAQQFYLSSLVQAGYLLPAGILVLLSIIPFLNILVYIVWFVFLCYSLYLDMKIVRMVNNLSRVKAAIAYLLPIVVVMAILAIMFAVLAAAMTTLGAGAYGGY